MAFGTIEQAIQDIRAGKFVIVADDEDRENEGDLICAAQLVTPELVNFMIRRAGGLICLALPGVPVDPATVPSDLRRGGHVFPLRAREGGVLQRVGHTEAAVDLARLAGLYPAGVICEILNEDGTAARRPELEAFCAEHGLTFITVAQLVAHRLQHERLVHRVAEARLPTEFGEFRIVGYRNDVDTPEHVALVLREVEDGDEVLV